MTKTVRVENADTSSYKIAVEVWEKGKPLVGANVVGNEPDTLVVTHNLDHPTALVEAYLTSTRYIKIIEK